MGLNRLMERIRMPIILVSGADEHGLHDGAGQQLARLAARWRERCADGHWRRRRIGMRYAMHAYREARAGGWLLRRCHRVPVVHRAAAGHATAHRSLAPRALPDRPHVELIPTRGPQRSGARARNQAPEQGKRRLRTHETAPGDNQWSGGRATACSSHRSATTRYRRRPHPGRGYATTECERPPARVRGPLDADGRLRDGPGGNR